VVARRPRHFQKLAAALLVAVACSSTPSSPTGLLSTPAGLTLSGTLMFISNEDSDELHLYDTQANEFIPAPAVLFPLSIPTVSRPYSLCSDTEQVFVASSVQPLIGVVDAVDDPTSHLPQSGLRELGEVTLPGVAQQVVCTQSPEAVLAREISVGGSPAGYLSMIGSGQIVIDAPDGSLPSGSPDERNAVALLPTAAIALLNSVGQPAEFYEIQNDITGASCPDSGAVETCAPGAVFDDCPNPRSFFCPSVGPLLTLPAQPPECNPIGPPLVGGFDIAGSGPGTFNLGAPSDDPSTANWLVASDRNSECVAAVNLSASQGSNVTWMPSGSPTTAVASLPYYPGTCVAAGGVFAAALDSENCEVNGPPPTGGYLNCNGVVFFDAVGKHARLPAPLPYPFDPALAPPLPPVRVYGIVTSLQFVGPGLTIGDFDTAMTNPVPVQDALIAGTTDGDLVYIDLGFGFDGGGTGNDDGGGYACPPAYFAPRILDQNDYQPGPVLANISNVALAAADGTALTSTANTDLPTTAGGAPLALDAGDRFGNPFATFPSTQAPVTCYGTPPGVDGGGAFELCLTDGMVQHGAADDETFTITYQGPIGGLQAQPGSVNGATLQSGANVQLETYLGPNDGGAGVIVNDQSNLTVSITTTAGVSCGNYLITTVTPETLLLAPTPDGQPLSCATGTVTFSVLAGGSTPYTVAGSESGFIGLWPADGTLHFVQSGRWQYPANLIAMATGAQQLTDVVLGPLAATAAPGSTLSVPRPEDYQALESGFGLAMKGVPVANVLLPDGGTVDGGAAGTAATFLVGSAVSPVVVNPEDTSALIDSMASYTDTGGGRHLFASYRGNDTIVILDPDEAIYTAITEIH
jgi:hypothetical protein